MKSAEQLTKQICDEMARTNDKAYLSLAEAVLFLLDEAPAVIDCRGGEDWQQDGDS